MTYLTNPDDTPSIFDDDPQATVFEEYHEGTGRVVVGAGAGTGKTTTLIDVVAEAVIEKLETESGNPMSDLLVTTFTKDAAGELKTKLKQRLRLYEQETDSDLPADIWRWIETDSYIETIDSFTQRLLREVAVDAGVAPNFEIRDGLESEDIHDEIFEAISEDPEFEDAIQRLTDAYPSEEWRDFPPDDLQDMIVKAHKKSREFCWSAEQMGDELLETHRASHSDRTPPFDNDDVAQIAQDITGQYTFPPSELSDHASNVYRHNEQLLEDFKSLLIEFDNRYDTRTRESGQLSHTDVTYLVWKHLHDNPDGEWASGLSERFDHVLIDEFQDTSYAQCRIISRCFREDGENATGTKALLIGDVKQSIYQWRSADPQIFAEIIENAQEGEVGEYLELENLEYRPLTTNFRSHPDLVDSANHLFSRIFDDPGRGDIGPFSIPFECGTARRSDSEPPWADTIERSNDESVVPRLHVQDLEGLSNQAEWYDEETTRIARAVSGIIGSDQMPVLDEEATEDLDDPQYRRPHAGDITLLFSRRREMARYAESIRQYGVDCAIDVSTGLFNEPEVRLLIDVLDWFANPHEKDSLVRILRSSVTALEDQTIRYLASENYYLTTALSEWPEELPDHDRDRLEALLQLRDDLRWDRETAKADLVVEIIQHTAFDTIVLSGDDGRQQYGNLWLITEIATEWEEEELLTYREFVVRLKRLRSRAQQGDDEHQIAKVADEDSESTVRLTTVHQSKGLEYPIVFLPELLYSPRDAWFPWNTRMMLSRNAVGIRPDIGEFEPVEFAIGGSDYWLTDDYNPFVWAADGLGTTWLTGRRGDNGAVVDNHPLADNFASTMAEFWRSLYVAYTRAADHVVMGISDQDPGADEHSTWNTALRDTLDIDGRERVANNLLQTQIAFDDQSRPLYLGIDDMPSGAPADEQRIGMDVVEDAIHETAREETTEIEPEFFPESLSPSSVHELLSCPLRYQYSTLEEISSIRAKVPPGSQPPGDLQRSQWGDLVHEFLEHEVIAPDEATTLAETYNDEIESELTQTVRNNLENSGLASDLESASKVLPEHELTVYAEDIDCYLKGKIDLLYQNGDGWHIVDYKTGRQAEDGEYIDKMYHRQLAAYAWLIDSTYDIDIESVELLYIHPDVVVEEVDIDPDEFSQLLIDAYDRLEVVSGQGLPAVPNPSPMSTDSPDLATKCGSCAYRSLCPEWD